MEVKQIIPITRFDNGDADKVFEEVELEGPKIVVENNKPVCVLLSPSRYESLMNWLSDYDRLIEAVRIPAELKSEKEV